MNEFKQHKFTIIMMFTLFFMVAFINNIPNPYGAIINYYIGNSAFSQLGSLTLFIAYFIMGIPSGLILNKIGFKKTSLFGIGLGIIGLIIIAVSCFLTNPLSLFIGFLIGTFISGCSGCFLNTILNPMLNTLGSGGNKGNQLLQYAGVFNGLGLILVPFISGIIVSNLIIIKLSNLTPLLLITIIIFIIAFIIFIFLKLPEPDIIKTKKHHKNSPLSFKHFKLGLIAIFCYMGIFTGIPNIINLYITSILEFNPLKSGFIVSLFFIFLMIGRLFAGFIGNKISSQSMLKYCSSLPIILLLIGIILPTNILIFNIPLNLILISLTGLFVSVMWGTIYNLTIKGLGAYTSKASGIFMMMCCGAGLIPVIQGFIADLLNSYMFSFIIIIILFTYIFWYSIKGYKNVNKNIKVD